MHSLVACLLTLGATAAVAIPETASSVCVYNDAAFVLKWKLLNKDTGAATPDTKSYPVWESKCVSAASAGTNVSAGASLVPVVSAAWGKTITVDTPVLYDPINASQITYVCKGTTLDFSCKQGVAPPTAGNVTKAALRFLEGFTLGLGTEIGFSDCIKDINATYHEIVTIVDFFESGINQRTVKSIAKAFELVGDLLKDVAAAVTACVKDAKDFVAKIKDVAAALSGNVWSIIKVVIDEAVHIFHERKELTADCKTCASSWRGGDYKGSGNAVGEIVGIIIAGL